LKEKKREYELQCQVQLLATYFGPEQKDYWRVFFSERVPTNPLSDVAAWTDYFRALLGAVPEALLLSDEELALRAQLFDAAPKGAAEDMAELNAPVTLEEARACMLLPTGRAADLQGFTGELLKGAGSEVPVRGQDIGRPVCPPAIECAQWLLQQLLSSGQVPDSMCVSKLVPVPKSTQPAALGDRDMYRGISVSALFSRLLDRLMNKRFEGVVSRLGLRSPTQCGFRPGHGTLDAIFTLHHLISAAQHNRQRLFVVFVDFKKALTLFVGTCCWSVAGSWACMGSLWKCWLACMTVCAAKLMLMGSLVSSLPLLLAPNREVSSARFCLVCSLSCCMS
jgi:hypothetical protein